MPGVDSNNNIQQELYQVTLEATRIEAVSTGMTLCHVLTAEMRHQSHDGHHVLLCRHCKEYLRKNSRSNNETVNQARFKYAYPSFIWGMLRNQELIQQHGLLLWSLVPSRWRPWWIKAVNAIPAFANVTVDSPFSLIADVMVDEQKLRDAIAGKQLANLVQTCNEKLKPVVKCPYGCTEFYHETGTILLDVLYDRILGPKLITFTTDLRKRRKFVASIRDDFLSIHSQEEYFAWGKPLGMEWKIQPSISFDKDGKPVILTCRNHGGGTRQKMFHVPPAAGPFGTLPPTYGDQIAPVGIMPRVLKAARASKYSHTYSMNKMQGSYGGVDSVNLTTFQKQDYMCPISDSKDGIAIANRDDLRAHVTRLSVDQDPLPLRPPILHSSVANGKLLCAALEQSNAPELKSMAAGANFITLEDAAKLNMMMKTEGAMHVRQRLQVVDANGMPLYDNVPFTAPWPKLLTNLHPCNDYGESPPLVPALTKDYDYRFLWTMVALNATIAHIWEGCAASVPLSTTDDYQGWLLRYATDECFPEKRKRLRRPKDAPFVYPGDVTTQEKKQNYVMMQLVRSAERQRRSILPPVLGHFFAQIPLAAQIGQFVPVLQGLQLPRVHGAGARPVLQGQQHPFFGVRMQQPHPPSQGYGIRGPPSQQGPLPLSQQGGPLLSLLPQQGPVPPLPQQGPLPPQQLPQQQQGPAQHHVPPPQQVPPQHPVPPQAPAPQHPVPPHAQAHRQGGAAAPPPPVVLPPFNLASINNIFIEQSNVLVVNGPVLPAANTVASAINVLLLIGNRFPPGSEHGEDLQLPGSETKWQLCFVAATQDSMDPASPGHWSGTMLYRHGGWQFPGWWKTARKQDYWQRLSAIDETVLASSSIRVYKHCVNQDIEAMRNTFMSYLGGQHHAVCELHGKPLIVSVSGDCNCHVPCPTKRKAEFRCSNPSCSIAICKKHFQELKKVVETQAAAGTRAEQVQFQVWPAPATMQAPPAARVPHPAPTTEPVPVDSDDDEEDEDFTPTMMIPQDVHPHMNDGDFLTDLYDNLLHIDDDDEQFVNQDDLNNPVNAQAATLLPMTDAGVAPTEVVMKDDDDDVKFMPLHAILNNCGSCLTRKH
jgi:hypothetical protein